jgi:hypothetical protein
VIAPDEIGLSRLVAVLDVPKTALEADADETRPTAVSSHVLTDELHTDCAVLKLLHVPVTAVVELAVVEPSEEGQSAEVAPETAVDETDQTVSRSVPGGCFEHSAID